MSTALFYRNSSNLLILEGLVDWFERDAQGAPTPVTTGVTVTGQVFAADRTTALSSVISLTQEADQAQNYYRGIVPQLGTLDDPHAYVSIKFLVDGGSDIARAERWLDAKVVDE